MVVKLAGLVNGGEVIFTKKSEEYWETSIPANLSGIYVVELTAYDEAGNSSFATKYILTVDVGALKVTLQPLEYQATVLENDYVSEVEVC